jgi:hypothetical protein
MNRLILLALLGTPAGWASVLTFADNCVQTTTNCNVASEGNNSSTPVSLLGTFGSVDASDTVNLAGSGTYGYLHGSSSGSLGISGTPATIYGYGGASFQDTLTISDPSLTGQTGYLQIGYSLDGTVSSSGQDDGSILAIADVGGVGNPGTAYSANVYNSSVNGDFVFTQLFTFSYGTPFSFGVGLYTAVGTGTWIADPTSSFGFDYGFSPLTGSGSASANAADTLILSLLEVENSDGQPVAGVSYSSASGTIYGPQGVVPEPSTLLFVLPAFIILCVSVHFRRRSRV